MPDNCAICLSSLSAEVYVPCSNHHRFHKHCLMEWATTLHNCPICRQEIQMIRVLKDGKELKVVKPPKLIQKKREELDTVIMETPYDTMHCELCQLATDEARMLVCDACDLGFHMNCLRPPLKTVPRGLWECEECRNTRDNFLQSVSPRISPQMEYELNEKEDGEIADSDEKNTLINMFDNEDEHILAEDTNIPSTSRQPTVTMKELREKRIRSKSRRNKTKKSKKSTKRTKLRRKRDSKKKSKHGYSDKDKTYSHVADVCSIKRNDNYQVVRRGGETSYKSAVVSFGRLDLFGRQYIPSLDNEDVDVKQKSYATESTNLELNNSLKHKFTGSISLLDEILANQKVVLAPGKLLKINRDGTIQETEQLRQYIEKRDNTKNETGSVEEYPSRSNSVLLDKFKQIQKSHDGDYQQKLYDATFSVPKSNMNITYKNCKPMSIVNPMIKTKYAQVSYYYVNNFIALMKWRLSCTFMLNTVARLKFCIANGSERVN